MQETAASRRWRAIVEEQEASGLSVRAFAESRNLKPGTLGWWRARIRRADREAGQAAGTPQFTALTVAEPAGTVVLALDNHEAHLVIDQNTDLRLVRQVLEAMA